MKCTEQELSVTVRVNFIMKYLTTAGLSSWTASRKRGTPEKYCKHIVPTTAFIQIPSSQASLSKLNLIVQNADAANS